MGQEQRKILTDVERGILKLLKDEPLTIKQITRRRKTSRQATEKHIKNLIKKGEIKRFGTLMVAYRCTPLGVSFAQHNFDEGIYKATGSKHPVRLHGEEYKVNILSDSEKYRSTRERANSILVDENRVVLYRDCLVVFSYKSFEGVDDVECDRQSVDYWHRFFGKLESYYGIMILKERYENIKRVKAHYSDTKNELASDLRQKKQKLRIFGSRDGKEWMLFDDSHALDEAETTHSETPKDNRGAKEDMASVVRPFFNDLRDNRDKVFLPSIQSEILRTGFTEVNGSIEKLVLLATHQSTIIAQQSTVNLQNSEMQIKNNEMFNQLLQVLTAQNAKTMQQEDMNGNEDIRKKKPFYLG